MYFYSELMLRCFVSPVVCEAITEVLVRGSLHFKNNKTSLLERTSIITFDWGMRFVKLQQYMMRLKTFYSPTSTVN